MPIGDHFTCHIGSEFTATVGSPTEEFFGVVAFRDDSGRVASDVLAAFDDAVEFDDGSGLLGRIEEGLEVRRDSAGDLFCVLGPFGQFGIDGWIAGGRRVGLLGIIKQPGQIGPRVLVGFLVPSGTGDGPLRESLRRANRTAQASQQHQQQSPTVDPNVDPTVDPTGDPTRIGQPNEPLLLQQIANQHSLDSLR